MLVTCFGHQQHYNPLVFIIKVYAMYYVVVTTTIFGNIITLSSQDANLYNTRWGTRHCSGVHHMVNA